LADSLFENVGGTNLRLYKISHEEPFLLAIQVAGHSMTRAVPTTRGKVDLGIMSKFPAALREYLKCLSDVVDVPLYELTRNAAMYLITDDCRCCS
jgi:hypothetical protein